MCVPLLLSLQACTPTTPSLAAFQRTRDTDFTQGSRRINNASLWRPYHWRKQTIVGRLPEILGREIVSDRGSEDELSRKGPLLANREEKCDESGPVPDPRSTRTLLPAHGSNGGVGLSWVGGGVPSFEFGGDRGEKEYEPDCESDGDGANPDVSAACQEPSAQIPDTRAAEAATARPCCDTILRMPRPELVTTADGALGSSHSLTRQGGDRNLKRTRDCLSSSLHLEKYPLATGPALDLAANEYWAFLGQSPGALSSVKDAGVSREASGRFPGNFGGSVVVSPSAFRANMSVPCAVCNGGHLGAVRPCKCSTGAGRWAGLGEQCMIVLRVVLGDCHVVQDYDEVAYKGLSPTHRPRCRPPINPDTGFVHDSILSESLQNGGTRHRFTEIAIFDRFQCYPEFMIYYRCDAVSMRELTLSAACQVYSQWYYRDKHSDA